jgi:hypothetical protein
VPVIIRLPENSDPISSFDISFPVNYTKGTRSELPCFFSVEGSLDGFTWTELFATNNVCSPEDGAWMMGGKYTSTGSMRTSSHYGVPLAKPGDSVRGPINSVSCVSVSFGATLKCLYGAITLDSFGIDMTSGGGTVEGFAFAEEGTLSLDNVVSGETLLEKTFTPVNCTGVTNLSNWTLMVNGGATSKYTASVSANGKVRLASVGMRVIIR